MTTLSPSGRSFFGVGVAAALAAGFEVRVGLALVAVATDGSSLRSATGLCRHGTSGQRAHDARYSLRGTVVSVWYCLDYMSINTTAAPPAHLTSTSYLVLGLIEREGPSTPYELKRHVAATIGHFWSFPHALLYTEPARLVELGLLTEKREAEGRRRRLFAITGRGRAAIRAWLAQPAVHRAALARYEDDLRGEGGRNGSSSAARTIEHWRGVTLPMGLLYER